MKVSKADVNLLARVARVLTQEIEREERAMAEAVTHGDSATRAMAPLRRRDRLLREARDLAELRQRVVRAVDGGTGGEA